MTQPHDSPRIGRSLAALLGGVLTVVLMSVGTDAMLHATSVFPPSGQPMSDLLFGVATTYRTIYAIAGSYVAARFAPNRPMGHALALGVIGLVLTIAGAAATWNAGPALGPRWYPLALVALAMPGAWVGGRLSGASSQGTTR